MKWFDCLKDWSCLLMFRDAGIQRGKWKRRLYRWFWRRSHQELQSQGMYSTLLNPRPWSASDTGKNNCWLLICGHVCVLFVHSCVSICTHFCWPSLASPAVHKTLLQDQARHICSHSEGVLEARRGPEGSHVHSQQTQMKSRWSFSLSGSVNRFWCRRNAGVLAYGQLFLKTIMLCIYMCVAELR